MFTREDTKTEGAFFIFLIYIYTFFLYKYIHFFVNKFRGNTKVALQGGGVIYFDGHAHDFFWDILFRNTLKTEIQQKRRGWEKLMFFLKANKVAWTWELENVSFRKGFISLK